MRCIVSTRWLGKALRWLETVTSTQDEAKEWVQSGAPHGAVVVADQQTAGRGRWGRSWFSPPGKNLYLTAALQVPATAPPLGTLSLLVGIAIAEALRTHFQTPVFVKWANDVVAADGRKLAGILIEQHENWALVGIGANVNLTTDELPDELKPIAVSLRCLVGKELDRWAVLDAILHSLEAWWDRWAVGDTSPFWQAWAGLDWLYGKRVQVLFPDGTTMEGIAKGVAETGALQLQLDNGLVQTVVAGDVTVRALDTAEEGHPS